jgi:hypothetical protein
MLRMFYNVFQVYLGIFVDVLGACFKCFIYLLLCVSSVASGCFKSRSGCCIYVHTTSTSGMGHDIDWHGGERGVVGDRAQWGRAVALESVSIVCRGRGDRSNL